MKSRFIVLAFLIFAGSFGIASRTRKPPPPPSPRNRTRHRPPPPPPSPRIPENIDETTARMLGEFRSIFGDSPLVDAYTVVYGPDKRFYLMYDPTNRAMLDALVDANAKLGTLFASYKNRYNIDGSADIIDTFTQRRVSLLYQKHPEFYPHAGALTSGIWIGIGPEMTWLENSKQSFGIVLHELAHVLCKSAETPEAPCRGHGPGWCRMQARLVVLARQLGLWERRWDQGLSTADINTLHYDVPP